MPAVTIRNLSEETHRALKVRAARHGRSAEAEIRAILEQAVRPTDRVRLGALLADIGKVADVSDDDLAALETQRDGPPTGPPELD
jgi:plasmid stability protein